MGEDQEPERRETSSAPPQRRAVYRPLPEEGDGGLYSQSWFPVCLSADLQRGKALTCEFLGGKVVAYRGEDGIARVMSAYCLHLGADLGLGTVVGNELVCAFHKWVYDGNGLCVRTGCGDPAPKGASLFRFPTRERYGLIWAFNGEEPPWEPPAFKYPDDALYVETSRLGTFNADPWVIMCNTPDTQHIELLHGMRLDPLRLSDYRWTDHGFRVDATGTHWMGRRFDWTWGIDGTNIFFQEGPLDGRYFGIMTPMSIPVPKRSMAYVVIAVLKDSGAGEDLEAAKRWAREAYQLEMDVVAQDADIIARSRFRHGILTAKDAALARFMDYLRRYPRANPALEFIT